MLRVCRRLLNDHLDFPVYFVRKQANQVAHLIARMSCEIGCFHYFPFPQSVLESLSYHATLNLLGPVG